MTKLFSVLGDTSSHGSSAETSILSLSASGAYLLWLLQV